MVIWEDRRTHPANKMPMSHSENINASAFFNTVCTLSIVDFACFCTKLWYILSTLYLMFDKEKQNIFFKTNKISKKKTIVTTIKAQ